MTLSVLLGSLPQGVAFSVVAKHIGLECLACGRGISVEIGTPDEIDTKVPDALRSLHHAPGCPREEA